MALAVESRKKEGPQVHDRADSVRYPKIMLGCTQRVITVALPFGNAAVTTKTKMSKSGKSPVSTGEVSLIVA